MYELNKNKAYCEEIPSEPTFNVEAGKFKHGLITFTEEQVMEHGKNAQRVWVTYKDGVYDITDFLESHPGNVKRFVQLI